MLRRHSGTNLGVILFALATSCGQGESPASAPTASSITDTRDTESDLGVRTKSQIKAGKSSKAKSNSRNKQPSSTSTSADQTQRAVESSRSAPGPSTSSPPTSSPPTTAPTTPASSDCYKGDEFTCKVESEIVRLTNEKRVGLSPLRHDKNLAFVARDWSRQQGQSRSISHNGFPGARAQVYQKEFGQSGSVRAENVAMFSGNGASAEEVAKRFVEMWYGSTGHRANMLGGYGSLGAGVFKSGFGFYGTQIFGN